MVGGGCWVVSIIVKPMYITLSLASGKPKTRDC